MIDFVSLEIKEVLEAMLDALAWVAKVMHHHVQEVPLAAEPRLERLNCFSEVNSLFYLGCQSCD